MKANVGGIDRAVRIIAGLAILSLYLRTGRTRRAGGRSRASSLLGTGFIRWCPAYLPFGISSSKAQVTR